VSIEKREYTRRTIMVEAAGQQFEMTRLSAADWIALRRGDLDDGGLVASALGAIVDSSLPDGAELDLEEGLALMRAWVKAHKDDAVPPA
jgi:hypothetical protein